MRGKGLTRLLQFSTNEPLVGTRMEIKHVMKLPHMSHLNTLQTFLPRPGVVKDRLQTDTHIPKP